MKQQTATPTSERPYIDEREFALRTTLSLRTIQQMRSDGGGPPYAKLKGRVIYRWTDVERWIAEHTRSGAAS